MLSTLKVLIPSFIIFVGIDMLWLGIIAKGLYGQYIGSLMRARLDSPHLVAAGVTWLFLVLGLYFFVLPKVVDTANPISMALIIGALFGLIVYGVYDLTNYATLKNWPFMLVIIDMCWGMVVCGINSVIIYQLSRFLR